MTGDLDALLASMRARGISSAIIDRVRRLNPNHTRGHQPRGWTPAPTLRRMVWLYDAVGKREFIGKFGRAAWANLAKDRRNLLRDGKRVYARREAVEDRLWLAHEPTRY